MKSLLYRMLPWVLLVALTVIMVNSCHQNNQDKKDLQHNLVLSQDSVKHFKDKNDQLVNQVQVIKIESNNFKYQALAFGIDVKKLREQVGKQGKLISYYKAQLEITETFTVAGEDSTIIERVGDTSKVDVKYFPYHSKWLTADMFYFPISDSLRVDYRYTTGFTYTMYDKKVGLFKPRQTYVDFVLEDPHASLSQAQSILIVSPKKKVYERNWFWGGVGVIAGLMLGR